MSVNNKTTATVETIRKVNLSPNREELKELYAHLGRSFVEKSYALFRSNYPPKKGFPQPNCFIEDQYREFIRVYGLPKNHKKSDFPFLDGVKIF